MARRTAFVDKYLGSFISKKLLVWTVATIVFLTTGNLKSGDWLILSAIYIGGQSVIDAVKTLKGSASSTVSTTVQTAINTMVADKNKKDETGKVPKSASKTDDIITK